MRKEGNVDALTEETCVDLLPGFYNEIPDLSVRVWSDGRVEVTSGHRNKTGVADSGVALVVFRGGIPYRGIPVARLMASAFYGVGLEQIESVKHLDDDGANCTIRNLELVKMKDATSEKAIVARRKAARAEGHRLAWDAVYSDEDGNIFQYELVAEFS